MRLIFPWTFAPNICFRLFEDNTCYIFKSSLEYCPYAVSCMTKSWHKNSMHENDISMLVFCLKKFAWMRIPCMKIFFFFLGGGESSFSCMEISFPCKTM